MIISEHPQGSPEWLLDRLGVPTASNFSKIITATGKPSTSSGTYMNQLLAEWLLKAPVDQVDPTIWMQRGNELEPAARSLYEFIQGLPVEQVGFCTNDDKLIGCSPDGLIGEEGLIEIKCPKASTMIGYVLSGKLPSAYKQQVQGQMWITERQWCAFMAYHPDMEPFIVKVGRDEKYIKSLSEAVNDFVDEMLEKREKLMGDTHD